MVEIIGLGTMSALVWLLAWSMANESQAEQRRMPKPSEKPRSSDTRVSRPKKVGQAA